MALILERTKNMAFRVSCILICFSCIYADAYATDYNAGDEYARFIEARFGTDNNRPPKDVFEQRCIESVEQLFSVMPSAFSFERYPFDLMDAWAKSAGPKSKPHLEKWMTTCWLIKHEKVLEAGYGFTAVSKHLWLSMTEIWLSLEFKNAQPIRKGDIFVDAISEEGRLKLHPFIVGEDFVLDALPASSKGKIFAVIMSAKTRPSAIYTVLALFSKKGFAPNQDQLQEMLDSKNDLLTKLARLYYARALPGNADGLSEIMSQLSSTDFKVLHEAAALLREYLRANIADATKDKIFRAINKRYIELENNHDKKLYLKSSIPLKGDIEGRLPALLVWQLVQMERMTPLLTRHKKSIRGHVAWLEQYLRTDSGKGDTYIAGEVNRWKQTLNNLK